MFDKSKFNDALRAYKNRFVEKQWPEEKNKWKAVKCFQDNWDINSPDFAGMLDKALSQTNAVNLLAGQSSHPLTAILNFAKNAPEEVRSMFLELYDEQIDLTERMNTFRSNSTVLKEKYRSKPTDNEDFQEADAIFIYLWLRYPDKYYIYKYGAFTGASSELGSSYKFKKISYAERYRNFLKFYDELSKELGSDHELRELLDSQLTPEYYSDPQFHTLTSDFCFYVGSGNYEKDCLANESVSQHQGNNISNAPKDNKIDSENEPRYWFLIGSPSTWGKIAKLQSMTALPVGESAYYTLYTEKGYPRKKPNCFLDAKVGDLVIGYESSPVKKVTSLFHVSKEQDGEKIYFEKDETLSSPIDYSVLADSSELKAANFDLKNVQGSLFDLTKEAYDFIMGVIREKNPIEPIDAGKGKYTKEDFLCEVYMSSDEYDRLSSVLLRKKNIILQGAPGVGKTFAAKRLAYSMMGEEDNDRVEFVQFHQNYSYEDFVKGYKPVENGFELRDGVFYRFCQEAGENPSKNYFFIIDEINRGNISKIFGELLMLIENDHRGEETTLAYDKHNDPPFSVPENLYIIGMMNTADRSLAMIDYALRRRFSFFDIEPGFNTDGFKKYQDGLNSETFDALIEKIVELNKEIESDKSLGKGFRIGHSYFCNATECTKGWMRDIIDFDIVPMLTEYWFDDEEKVARWNKTLQDVLND